MPTRRFYRINNVEGKQIAGWEGTHSTPPAHAKGRFSQLNGTQVTERSALLITAFSTHKPEPVSVFLSSRANVSALTHLWLRTRPFAKTFRAARDHSTLLPRASRLASLGVAVHGHRTAPRERGDAVVGEEGANACLGKPCG
eukprot:1245954-Rhodomonas_salina.3